MSSANDSMKNQLSSNAEEMYFHKLNQELIEKLRQQKAKEGKTPALVLLPSSKSEEAKAPDSKESPEKASAPPSKKAA